MNKYYSPVIDAAIYITNAIEGQSINDIVNELCANHMDIADEITTLLAPSCRLEEALNRVIKLESVKYDFYFKLDLYDKNAKTSFSNAASLMLSDVGLINKDCRDLDLIRESRLRMTKKQKLHLFASSSLLNQHDKSGELRSILVNEDEQALLKYIARIDVPACVKRKLTSLYINYEEHLDELIDLLRPVVSAIIENESIYIEPINKAAAMLDDVADIRQYTMEKYGILLSNSNEKCYIYINMLEPSSVTVYEGYDGAENIIIGACMEEIAELLYAGCDSNKLASRFKVLSDETRLNILRCICNRPCYGLELAEIFSISAPTVSYHMNKLLLNGFVESSFEGGKLYYRARMDNIDAFNEMFKRFIHSPSPDIDDGESKR